MDYTKGEWKAWKTDIKPDRWMICAGTTGDQGIAKTVLDNSITPAEKQANAQLISAAPSLYEALKAIQKWLLFDEEMVGRKAQLYNAQFIKANNLTTKVLAKVEGKT